MAPSSSCASLGHLEPSSLRQLVSLDSPRVALGKRVPFIKEERGDDRSFLLSSSPPLPEISVLKVKKETDDSPRRFSCALCTSRPGEKKLSSFCPPDPRRAEQLASLLGRSEEEVDIIFCSVCRQTVTKLFQLREEVEEIEARIPTVVRLQPPTKPLGSLGAVVKKETGSEDAMHEKPGDRVDVSFVSSSEQMNCLLEFHPRRKVIKAKIQSDSLMKKVHKRKTVDIGTLPPIKSIKKGSRTLFFCPKCPQKFTRKDNVPKHLRMIHGLNVSRRKVKVCLICKKRFRSSEVFKTHTHPDKNDPSVVSYTCHICQKSYSSPSTLVEHKRQVHLKKSQCNCNCPHCGKQFQTRRNLQNHIGKTCPLVSKDERKCHCGQVFASGAERLKHENVSHKAKCYFCSKVLSSAQSLHNHERLHTRERPFVCDKCGRGFADPSSLRRHMLIVCGADEKKKEELRRQSREKMRCLRAKLLHPCVICDKRFGEKKGLINHQKRHH